MVDYKKMHADFLTQLRSLTSKNESAPIRSGESIARQITTLEHIFEQIPDTTPQFLSGEKFRLTAESVFHDYDAVSIIVSLPYSQGRQEMTEKINVGTMRRFPLGLNVCSPEVQIGFVQINGARVHRSMKMGWQQMIPQDSLEIVERQLAELKSASNKRADLLAENQVPEDIVFGLGLEKFGIEPPQGVI